METHSRHPAALAAGTALTALLSFDAALAGGFAIREQSAAGQGASFAGVAAGGSPASMFWNPATMTQFYGRISELDAAVVAPTADQSGTGTLSALGFTAGLDSGETALIPASYTTWQLNDRFWIGLSTNSPYGLSVGFQNPRWAGAAYAQSTTLRTYNATPSFAFRVNEWLSVGAGVQIQYATANLTSFNGLIGLNPNLFIISGEGWGFGFTAGATLTPTPTTSIGVGYRSRIDQDIEGTLVGTGVTAGSVNTSIALPDMISVGVRQGLGPGWTLLGTFEWTNWSRIGTSIVQQASGAPALAGGGAPITLPFQYDDGFFYAVGIEYALTPTWTVRGGFAFEQSPIVDAVRTPRLPDNDRFWYSVGATNQLSPRIVVDVGYSFIDVQDTPINITPGSGNPWFIPGISYTGTADSHVHIFAVGAKYRWN